MPGLGMFTIHLLPQSLEMIDHEWMNFQFKKTVAA